MRKESISNTEAVIRDLEALRVTWEKENEEKGTTTEDLPLKTNKMLLALLRILADERKELLKLETEIRRMQSTPSTTAGKRSKQQTKPESELAIDFCPTLLLGT